MKSTILLRLAGVVVMSMAFLAMLCHLLILLFIPPLLAKAAALGGVVVSGYLIYLTDVDFFWEDNEPYPLTNGDKDE